MPLGPEYDKLIDSKIADMKNTGGRHAGSITGAQFLQRFVENDTPWAHLDVAGTAMGSPANETNQSWGSGWGVRLLDEFVRARFERQVGRALRHSERHGRGPASTSSSDSRSKARCRTSCSAASSAAGASS